MTPDRRAIENELLVLRCRLDRAAWPDLVARWERPLFYYVRRLVDREADAWDVLQQTWLAAFNGIGSLRDGKLLPVWLHRIARNLALNHARAAYPAGPLPEELAAAAGDADDDPGGFERADDAARVHAALAALSLPHREVLTLHFLQGMGVEQIAAVTGVPGGTIKSRLHYARRALRRRLEDREGGPP